MTTVFGAQGVSPTLRGQPSNVFSLKGGEARLVPAGTWRIKSGPYTAVQEYDPITGIWRGIGSDLNLGQYVNSDGANYRVANQTGCIVGALITAGGSGYTSDPTITASSGSAVFNPVIGGAVNTSVTVTNGGTGYTYAPIVMFDAPPAGNGVQATGYATLTSGVVSSITIVNQGAGYTNAPVVYLQNDPRDTTGANAAATTTLTGAGTITAILVTDHGNPVTETTTVPTLAFSGGGGTGAAATAIMCWTVTAYTVTTAGSGYSGNVGVTTLGGGLTGTPSTTNVTIQSTLVRGRSASIQAALSAGTLTATGQTVFDGGILTGLSTGLIEGSPVGTAAAVGAVGFAYGSAADTVTIWSV